MIEPTELRIGNCVQRENEVIVVDAIVEFEINVWFSEEYDNEERLRGWSKSNGFSCADINGIPLTEEWLLKLGFHNRYPEYYSIEIEEKRYLDFFMKDNMASILGVVLTNNNEIRHVHQLQNLYFALMGQELAIKKTENKMQDGRVI